VARLQVLYGLKSALGAVEMKWAWLGYRYYPGECCVVSCRNGVGVARLQVLSGLNVALGALEMGWALLYYRYYPG
jgi:hypothetical protein